MSASKDRWWRINNPIMWAVLASFAFFTLLTYLGRVPTCNIDLFPKGDCPAKWRHIVSAPINEVGDTLAGLAGVLAFIWLVATVLLQAHELREQRKDLREQRAATQDMAKAMAAQAEIFEVEQNQRLEDRAKQYLDELLLSLAAAIEGNGGYVKSEVPREEFGGLLPNSKASFSFSAQAFSTDFPSVSPQKLICDYWEETRKAVIIMASGKPFESDLKDFYFRLVLEAIDPVLALESELSRDQTERLKRLNIRDSGQYTKDFLLKEAGDPQ